MTDELRGQEVALNIRNRLLEDPMQILKLLLKKLTQVCKCKSLQDQLRTESHPKVTDLGQANQGFRKKVKNRSLKCKFQDQGFLNPRGIAKLIQI
jgi:hypothetical protein